jgi:hypothetical protein
MGRVPSKGRVDRAKRQADAAAILERRPEIADKKLLRDKEMEEGAEYSTDLRGGLIHLHRALLTFVSCSRSFFFCQAYASHRLCFASNSGMGPRGSVVAL